MRTNAYERAYYQGVWDALLYQQADQDTEANKDQRPTVKARLPKDYWDYGKGEYRPFDLRKFAAVLVDFDDAGIVAWRLLSVDNYGESHIEVAGTEGYYGVPGDMVASEFPWGATPVIADLPAPKKPDLRPAS